MVVILQVGAHGVAGVPLDRQIRRGLELIAREQFGIGDPQLVALQFFDGRHVVFTRAGPGEAEHVDERRREGAADVKRPLHAAPRDFGAQKSQNAAAGLVASDVLIVDSAGVDLGTRRNVVIDAHQLLPLGIGGCGLGNVVETLAVDVRQRVELQQLRPGFGEQAGRQDARIGGIEGLSRRRVGGHGERRVAEIPHALFGGRNGAGAGGPQCVVTERGGEEEKDLGTVRVPGLGNEDGPADVEAVIVEAQGLLADAGAVADPVGGVQLVVAEKLEGPSVKGLSAAARDHVDLRALSVAILRAVRAGSDLHFLDAVDVGVDELRAIGSDRKVPGAVHHQAGRVAAQAVDVLLADIGAGVEGRGVIDGDARQKLQELNVVPSVQGKLGYLAPGHHRADLAAAGLHLRGGCGDIHHFANHTRRQIRIHGELAVGVKRNAGLNQALEAAGVDGDFISPVEQVGEDVIAAGIGGTLSGSSRTGVADGYVRSRHNRLRGVEHGS